MAAPSYANPTGTPSSRPLPHPLTRPQVCALLTALTEARDLLERQAALIGRPEQVAAPVKALDYQLALLEVDLAELDEAADRLAIRDGLTGDRPAVRGSLYSPEARAHAWDDSTVRNSPVLGPQMPDSPELHAMYPETMSALARPQEC